MNNHLAPRMASGRYFSQETPTGTRWHIRSSRLPGHGGYSEVFVTTYGNIMASRKLVSCHYSSVDGSRTYDYSRKVSMQSGDFSSDSYILVGQGPTPKEAKDNFLKLLKWAKRYTNDQLQRGAVEAGELAYDLYADFSEMPEFEWDGRDPAFGGWHHAYILSSPKVQVL